MMRARPSCGLAKAIRPVAALGAGTVRHIRMRRRPVNTIAVRVRVVVGDGAGLGYWQQGEYRNGRGRGHTCQRFSNVHFRLG